MGRWRARWLRRPRPASAYLLLGSNVGDRLQTLQSALAALESHEALRVEAVSAVYETEPLTVGPVTRPPATHDAAMHSPNESVLQGPRDGDDVELADPGQHYYLDPGQEYHLDNTGQECYLNLVARVTTTLGPRELLAVAHHIEAAHGRNRQHERRWGPRTLDIDILLYGDLALDETDLTIPHPRLTERAFALVPLAEVLPPGTRLPDGTTVTSHLARLAPISGVDLYVRLVEGPGSGAEPLTRRPPGPYGGSPRLGPRRGGTQA